MSLILPSIGSNLVTGAAPFDSTLIGNSIWLDGSADLFTKSSFAGHASKKVISVWVQRTGFSSFGLIRGTNSTGDRVGFGDNVSNNQVYVVVNGKNLYSNRIFRDIGWYHYLVSFDLTQSLAVNKVKVYINGVDLDGSGGWQTDERSTMSSSFATFDSSSVAQQIGRDGSGAMYLNAYLAQYCELDGQSIQSGDVAVSDFLDTYTFGTNGSQFIPKKDSDIAALATTAGGNSFCLDFSTASVALSSGVTPTSNAGTFSGSLSNLTDGDFTTDWRSNVDPATNVSNDHIAFDLGSAKDVKAVKITGRSSITGNFKVQFSDNGSDFTDTGTTFSNVSITTTANSGILDLTSDNPGSHRYWKLINISNSSGTSAWGFKQIILDSVSGNLGTDASGNGNDFSPTSISSINQSIHTPSKVYATLNPLVAGYAAMGVASGATEAVSAASNGNINASMVLPSTGVFYWEVERNEANDGGGTFSWYAGIMEADGNTNVIMYNSAVAYSYYSFNGDFFEEGSVAASGNSWNANGDKVAFEFDADNGTLKYYKNNSLERTKTGLTHSGGYVPFFARTGGSTSSTLTVKFKESEWAYTPPTSGALELVSTNRPTPSFQGIDYFDATLYEGNGNGQRVGDFVPFTDTYTVDKSAMFEEADKRYLSFTPSAGGDQKTFTFSTWFKLTNGASGQRNTFLSSGTTGGKQAQILYMGDTSEKDINVNMYNGSSFLLNLNTDRTFLDESQWNHLVVAVDTRSAVASANKVKIYINGVQQSTNGTQLSTNDYDSHFNANVEHNIGRQTNNAIGEPSWYLAETVMVEGSQLDPTSFGQVDTSTNRWVPKDVSGLTFGDEGWYLEYDGTFNSGVAATGAGKDSSGNNNHWAEQNDSGSAWATSDQFTDTPSQNFDNLGGAQVGGTISEGNTKAALGTGGNQIRSNFNLSSGKWYVESDIQATNNSASIGLVPSRSATFSNGPGRDANGGISYETDGDVFSDNVQNATAEASFAAGDVIQMAIDMDAKKVYFGKNNTFGGDPAAGTGGHFLPASILSDGAALITLGNYSGSQSSTQQINYGQFLNFDGGSTTNGFKYTPPTGFKAVNQDNLDDTASKITAWAWIKNQDAADNHMLFDRVRGVGEDLQLFASSTVAEATDANTLQRFLQRGAQVGNDAKVNTANESYVLWQWLLGDSATTGSSNDSGSINSTVIAADAGHFSVGTFTGAGGSSTIGHGLSAAPEFFLVKRIGTSGSGWFVYSKSTTDPNNKFLRLQGTNAEDSASGAWTPGATTMGLNESSLNGINTSGVEHLFIAFRSVPGVCKVGSFIGNFDHDGPYISLGFKPSWYMTKDITTTSSWYIYDSANYPFNSTSVFHTLANTNDAGGAGAFNEQDFLSDGVKNRGQNNDTNASGSTFLYLAMAEIAGGGTAPPIFGR